MTILSGDTQQNKKHPGQGAAPAVHSGTPFSDIIQTRKALKAGRNLNFNILDAKIRGDSPKNDWDDLSDEQKDTYTKLQKIVDEKGIEGLEGQDFVAWYELNEIVGQGTKGGKDKDSGGEDSFVKLKDKYLKKNGVDAHEIKYGILGKSAKVAHYDLYKNKRTGEIVIFKKGGKGDGIGTGEYID